MRFQWALKSPSDNHSTTAAYNNRLRKRYHKMSIILLIAAAVALWLLLWVWSHKGHGAIARGLRTIGALEAVISAYREGDYETALQKTEALKPGISKTAEYCFFRGSMLHHLGRFDEAEASLREGLPL